MCTCCPGLNRLRLSRRGILGGMAAGLVATAAPRLARAADARQFTVTPDAALKRLMDGHAQ